MNYPRYSEGGTIRSKFIRVFLESGEYEVRIKRTERYNGNEHIELEIKKVLSNKENSEVHEAIHAWIKKNEF